MKISFVVCTYDRDVSYRRLVESIRREFSSVSYEIVTVASDKMESAKCQWASQQMDVKLICVGDRLPDQKRQKSLYYYENLALSECSGDWIFITNDDTEFMPGSGPCFLEQSTMFDVLVIRAELDDPVLGKRAPVIGKLIKDGVIKELLLLDFAFIKSPVMRAIGGSDENLDWYGGGLDRSILVALQDHVKVGVMPDGGLTHHLELESRTPPHSLPDFKYLKNKWDAYQVRNPNVRISVYGNPKRNLLPMWYYENLWPFLFKVKKAIAKL